MKVRFLLDEHLSPRLKAALVRSDTAIDVIRVGDAGAPPLGTPDPDILLFAWGQQRLLVTENRKSMPLHIIEFTQSGQPFSGVLQIKARTPFSTIVKELYLIWEASEADEWVNRFVWLPL